MENRHKIRGKKRTKETEPGLGDVRALTSWRRVKGPTPVTIIYNTDTADD